MEKIAWARRLRAKAEVSLSICLTTCRNCVFDAFQPGARTNDDHAIADDVLQYRAKKPGSNSAGCILRDCSTVSERATNSERMRAGNLNIARRLLHARLTITPAELTNIFRTFGIIPEQANEFASITLVFILERMYPCKKWIDIWLVPYLLLFDIVKTAMPLPGLPPGHVGVINRGINI